MLNKKEKSYKTGKMDIAVKIVISYFAEIAQYVCIKNDLGTRILRPTLLKVRFLD